MFPLVIMCCPPFSFFPLFPGKSSISIFFLLQYYSLPTAASFFLLLFQHHSVVALQLCRQDCRWFKSYFTARFRSLCSNFFFFSFHKTGICSITFCNLPMLPYQGMCAQKYVPPASRRGVKSHSIPARQYSQGSFRMF